MKDRTSHLSDERCRVCGAMPGQPCRGAYGPVPWLHGARRVGKAMPYVMRVSEWEQLAKAKR